MVARAFLKKNIKRISETIRWMTLILCIHVNDRSRYINYVFNFGWIRTLVAMATYILHRLIMGNVEIDNFSVSKGIFGILFGVVLYVSFDFCPNR